MIRRLYFLLVVVFWATMNVLLWRSEMSGARNTGSALPAESVWSRVLTAPDDSSLEIRHRGQKVGHCRWVASVVEPAMVAGGEEEGVEGRVSRVAGYVLDFEGNFLVGETPQRLRFSTRLELGTGQEWRKMQMRLNLRPQVWEVRADAGAETVTLRSEGEGGSWERRLAFADLRRPETLLASLGLPGTSAWLGTLGLGVGAGRGAGGGAIELGLRWEAHTDWMVVGHSRLRVFRVEARLFDKYRAVVYVSRVGELLRVELPDEIVLVNEALANF
jgi:hypothetical protein